MNTNDLLTDLSIILNNTDYFIKYNKELGEIIANLHGDELNYYDINNEDDMKDLKKDLIKFLSRNYIVKLENCKEYAVKNMQQNLEKR